jgi:DNA-binding response OmpR family regulator
MLVTILVVEDDAATSEFLVDLLSFAGYATRVAASGGAALGMLRKHPASVVLLDRRLPDMDGLAVCRQIRQRIDPAVPIILLMADYSAELEAAARDAGVTAYLSKPFPPDVLLDRVAALVQV